MAKASGPKAYLNLEIRLAIAVSKGKLFPIERSDSKKDSQFSLLCPVCQDSFMGQFYVGECGHLPKDKDRTDNRPGFKVGECPDRGRKIDGKLVKVSAEELKALKESEESNVLDLRVFDTNDVATHTYPAGKSYWFEPERSAGLWSMLCELMDNKPDITFAGVANLRGTGEKLYRLSPEWEGIVVQQLLRPSDLWTYQGDQRIVKDKEMNVVTQLVDTIKEPFDPDEFHNVTAERIRELVAARLDGDSTPVVSAAPRAEQDDDLSEVLAAALEAAKKAKSA